MTLYLYEITDRRSDRTTIDRVLSDVDAHVRKADGELIEAQVTRETGRIFAIAEFASAAAVLQAEELGVPEVSGPHQVRLVGTDLAALKAAKPSAGYLVEWDLPAELTMDAYLARKKANAPKYANVPEVSFLRTYVREDMDKCLCFYDAPDEAAVLRARDAVETPVDRVHRLADEG